ncbi:hypothetical protein ANTPLA_LOCUS9308 [Anthophora plagiata]
MLFLLFSSLYGALPEAFYHSADVCVSATPSSTCCTNRCLRLHATASFEVVPRQDCNCESCSMAFDRLLVHWQSSHRARAKRNNYAVYHRNAAIIPQWTSTQEISPEVQVSPFFTPPDNILRNRGFFHQAGLFSS